MSIEQNWKTDGYKLVLGWFCSYPQWRGGYGEMVSCELPKLKARVRYPLQITDRFKNLVKFSGICGSLCARNQGWGGDMPKDFGGIVKTIFTYLFIFLCGALMLAYQISGVLWAGLWRAVELSDKLGLLRQAAWPVARVVNRQDYMSPDTLPWMFATNVIANTRRSSAHYQPSSLGSHRRHLVFQTMSAFQRVCRQNLTGEDQTIVSFGTLGRQYCRRQGWSGQCTFPTATPVVDDATARKLVNAMLAAQK